MRVVTPFLARLLRCSVLLLIGGPLAYAQTPVCGEAIKEEAAREINAAAEFDEPRRVQEEARIYEKYRFCLQDAQMTSPNDTFYVAARRCGASVSQLGSLYYEEMSCCGYDPQRRQFACPITIKQRGGFGGSPLPGSREYVYNCVADTNGNLVPVGDDSVHLSNERFGQLPPWQFAVIAAANQNLHTVQPMDGATRRARSILSWGLRPTNCNYQPIWGNALNYRIRRDQ